MSLRVLLAASMTTLAGTAGVAVAEPMQIWAYNVTPGAELTHPFYTGEPFLMGGGGGPGNRGWLDFHPSSASGVRGLQTLRMAGLGTRETVNTTEAGTSIYFKDPDSLTLHVRNGMTGQVGDVTIAGLITGYFSADKSLLTNMFTNPAAQT